MKLNNPNEQNPCQGEFGFMGDVPGVVCERDVRISKGTGKEYRRHGFVLRLLFGFILHSFVIILILLSILCLGEKAHAEEVIDLTSDERDFLAAHPVLKLGVGVAFPPHQYVEKDGDKHFFKGMAAETVQLLEKRLGVRMEPVWDITFGQALEMGRAGAIDIFPCIGWTTERGEFLTYTKPYLSYPLVIVSRDDLPFIGSVEDLRGLKVAEVETLSTHSRFINEYPHLAIDFVFQKNTPAMLEAISMGQADACVVDLAVASYVINKRGLANLKVAAPTKWDDNHLAMAVPKDRAILATILQKTLDSLTGSEKDAIRQRWIGLRYSSLVNPVLFRRILTQGGGAVVLVGTVILLWNRRLRREVTERKRAEESLGRSEAKYRRLYESITDAIVTMDMSGRIVEFNKAYSKMLGYSDSELQEFSSVQLTPAKWRALEADIVRNEILPNGYSDVYEKEFIRKDGSVFPVELRSFLLSGEDGAPENIWAIVRDISERKQAEEKLRASEALLLETGRMAKVGGWELDAKTRVMRWTDVTYEIHELPIGARPLLEEIPDSFHPEDRARLSAAIERALGAGELYDLELRLITAKGNHLWVRMICKPRMVEGVVVKLQGVLQDISERKRAEEFRAEIERIVMHDLRAPIASTVSGIELLSIQPLSNETERRIVSILKCQGQQMLDTLNLSLGLYNIEMGKYRFTPQMIDCAVAVREIAAGLLLLPKHADKRIDLAGESASCVSKGDPVLLRLALQNLLVNALEASSFEGEVLVHLARNGECIIKITNSGAIPAEIRERFFEKYVTWGKTRGTGIGTYSAKIMIEAQGGSIAMETSDKDDKTLITVRLSV